MLILAGDVGGTSTRLAFCRDGERSLEAVAEEHYHSADYQSLYDIVEIFLARHRFAPKRACFGVAGPVLVGKVQTPNLPWSIEAAQLARVVGLPEVRLINDLAANTYGIGALGADDFAVLNPGTGAPTGALALVSAGTGLGESLAYWDGGRHRPLPSEAGHADFAPRNDLEWELLRYLGGRFGRVSYERVLSGPGLANLYDFLRDRRWADEEPEVALALKQGDRAAVIGTAALAGRCPLCVKALEIFVAILGAECGNAALRFLATGGVYLGGGIAPRILSTLCGPIFLEAFRDKGRLSHLVASFPVKVILNDRAALLGAGKAALLQHI